MSDKLRDQDVPTALGYELDRKTLTPVRRSIVRREGADHGADPLGDTGDGFRWRMVPSGDVVDEAERDRRLKT